MTGETIVDLKKLDLIADRQLRIGGLIFALIGFAIIRYLKV